MRRSFAAPLVALALLVGFAAVAMPESRATAQEAPDGRISGTVTSGTAGARPQDVLVRLIILEDSSIVGDEQATAEDGTFEFTVPATARRTYVVSARYQGIQYIEPPVILSPDEREASVELRLYETTREVPELRIEETIVAVVGLDRARGEIVLRREDFLSVPGDRVFVGDEAGVTLRIPTPESTIDVDGGELDGPIVSIDTPLYPGAGNSIVTTYLIRYDPEIDRYRLRVTAPVPTDRIELRVPAGHVHRLAPLEGAERGDDMELPQVEGLVLETVMLEAPIEAGRGLLVDLDGLSGGRLIHPLTERPGSIAGAGLALALIAGAAAVALRRNGRAA